MRSDEPAQAVIANASKRHDNFIYCATTAGGGSHARPLARLPIPRPWRDFAQARPGHAVRERVERRAEAAAGRAVRAEIRAARLVALRASLAREILPVRP